MIAENNLLYPDVGRYGKTFKFKIKGIKPRKQNLNRDNVICRTSQKALYKQRLIAT